MGLGLRYRLSLSNAFVSRTYIGLALSFVAHRIKDSFAVMGPVEDDRTRLS